MAFPRYWYLGFMLTILFSFIVACSPVSQSSSRTVAQTAQKNTAPISGFFMWIDDCQSQKSRGQGLHAYEEASRTAKQPIDVGLFEHGWINTDNGQLFSGFSAETQSCLEQVLSTVHQHNGRVFLVLGIVLGKDGSTPEDIARYEQHAHTDKAYFKNITDVVSKYHYDGVISDIEAGDSLHPAIFTTYCQDLHTALQAIKKPFGIALIHKTKNQSEKDNQLNAFEDFPALGKTAEFFIIMALDQGHFDFAQPIVTTQWIKEIFAYTSATLPMEKVTWELASYCLLWDDAGKQVGDPGSCTYARAVDLRNHLKSIHQPVPTRENTLVHFTDTDGGRYFADPQTVAMFQFIASSAKTCIRGSYWLAGGEASANEKNTLTPDLLTSGLFC
ncbi:hypothetical protein EPA93_44930 [Ktedonosporobacter rubrisoli]|uniref:GH18 domain-containing protein n=1 Tax=Ktedonosporobacter rubrisoli TaxID=2509675 RepID=A0A4P6K3L0_KTERU|nr:hypothetical protein [Ktedonosporobacter rubrisoli]QBD82734.1 hypothetical protein EPA93_44930 [Ktedonosporobacter rubrisoli]